MQQPIRACQIEELLLRAHIEREGGIDLIEEYFAEQSSLDQITRYAEKLLQQTSDPKVQEAIRKNLSECIVVKMQYEKSSWTGIFRKWITRLGFGQKNREVKRAEKLLQRVSTPSLDSSQQDQ